MSNSVIKVAFSQAVYTVSEGDVMAQVTIIKTGSNVMNLAVIFATEQDTALSKLIIYIHTLLS